MKKLLWYGETCYIETGAGQVAKHLLPVFLELFEQVHLVAIDQWWEQPDLPAGLTISLSSMEDQWNVNTIKPAIVACDYDCLFLTTDLNLTSDLSEAIEIARAHDIPVVIYAAMDTNYYVESFFKVFELATIPAVYSKWCQGLVKKMVPAVDVQAIYHGCEPDVFYPLSEEERREARKEMFGIDDDTFLVINVNRNQVRKDLTRTMAAFHLFHLEHPNSVLYLHSKRKDLGGYLPGQANSLGLRSTGPNPEIVFTPDTYHEAEGVSRADLNRIYNCADVCISTSTGEGWGLTTTEAMAAGTPFIGPNNTTFPEILGNGGERGLLVESGGPNLWVVFYTITEMPRELTSVTGMRDALRDVYTFRIAAKQRAYNARQWTKEHTWQSVQEQWKQLFLSLDTSKSQELVMVQ